MNTVANTWFSDIWGKKQHHGALLLKSETFTYSKRVGTTGLKSWEDIRNDISQRF